MKTFRLGAELRAFFGRYADDERGNTAAIVAVCVVFLLGTAAMATDIGYVYWAKLRLQQSADAAALAGASAIVANGTADPIAQATAFSAAPGDKNASNGLTATLASGYPKLVCSTTLKNQHDPCLTTFLNSPPAGANAIQVVENATVPSFFARVFGVSQFTVSATATAAAQGGQPQPLDIEVILDTTSSMGTNVDPNCGLGGSSYRIDCARYGLRSMLLVLDPTKQYVGLIVFPGFPNSTQAAQDYKCSGGNPTITPYYTSGVVYQVVPLSNDYLASYGATNFTNTSDLARAAGGVTSCSQGVQAPGGQGTYYAAAFAAAVADLNANGHPGAVKAIVMLTDGEANAKNAIASVTVTNSGSNYNAAPTVSFSGGGGSGAAGTAVMSGSGPGQQVASVTITSMGSGYTSVPTMTFTTKSGKTGSGATGTAVLTNPPGLQQCHQSVTAGQAATAAGIHVYTVAYGSSVNTSDCSTDTAPTITPCAALDQTASLDGPSGNFYSDGQGGTTCPNAISAANLPAAFTSIASSITSVRLIPDSWTT